MYAVKFECVTFGSVAAKPPNPCEIADVNPSDLPPDSDMNLQPKSTDLHIIVYFSVPKDQNYAAIYFTVSGDNLSSDGPFSVTVNLGFCGRCPPCSRVCELLSWHYILEFEQSLKKYPPIKAGTPEPYVPPNRPTDFCGQSLGGYANNSSERERHEQKTN